MPQYLYECKNCKHQIDTWHSIKEKLTDCPQCNTGGSLYRIPDFMIEQDKTRKAGELVDRHIKETRTEIEQDRKAMKRRNIIDEL